ncbi:MAG TPA: cellulose biosynthesis cyclic di-GMP-binding regulatory protein BcsB, partial [Paraburkholderia sp.]|uniref:cellulose biosynthesis cyclic di-GMP-binding regulatory protein BcsB n=1 Tax=Paraburkholderia sp. TaxID=1926495 RepID=UPI002ED10665
HLPFSMLGAYQTLALRGLDDSRVVNVGVRLDRVVTAATLRLRYTYSPSLVFPMSHIKVSVNGEAVATVPLQSEQAGQAVTRDIALDPRFFTDFNQVKLNLIAHYTLDHCEDPQNSALWADVSPTSEVILTTSAVHLPNDLALLPAPFFDRRDVSRLTLPFLLPGNPDNDTLRSAGVLASWFGMLADYRQARFPVVSGLPADNHGVVIGVASSLPAQLKLPPLVGPTLMVVDNPAAQDKKLLIVSGRDNAEVQQAVNALVLGRAALSGSSTTVAHIDIGEPRKPYDAPRWVPVDRPVAFKELVDDPSQLQVSGSTPDAIRVNLRVPADLFSWSGTGVPLDLHYRYTAPTIVNNSALAVNINDQLVKSLRLPKAASEDGQGRMQLPVLADQPSHATNSIDIPAFRVGSSNQLQLRFSLDSQKTGLCQGVAANPVQAAVDPDSTIDFSHFVHYAQMPNLAFFANSGFPFTRYADLSQTAVVISPHPGADDLEAYLTMMGHMGQWTGYPALRVQVIRPANVAALAPTKDMLFIGGTPGVLRETPWQAALPLTLAALDGN